MADDDELAAYAALLARRAPIALTIRVMDRETLIALEPERDTGGWRAIIVPLTTIAPVIVVSASSRDLALVAAMEGILDDGTDQNQVN